MPAKDFDIHGKMGKENQLVAAKGKGRAMRVAMQITGPYCWRTATPLCSYNGMKCRGGGHPVMVLAVAQCTTRTR